MDPVDDASLRSAGSSLPGGSLKYCPNCGSKVEPTWKHCGHCGEALPVLDAGVAAQQPISHRDRLRVDLWQMALDLVKEEKFDEAETVVDRFLDHFPNNADGHALAATILVKRYRMDDARAHLDKAQALDQSSAYVHISSAQYWLALGIINEALDDLEKAEALAIGDPVLYNNLRMSISQLREKARTSYSRPISEPTDSWLARFFRRRKP